MRRRALASASGRGPDRQYERLVDLAVQRLTKVRVLQDVDAVDRQNEFARLQVQTAPVRRAAFQHLGDLQSLAAIGVVEQQAELARRLFRRGQHIVHPQVRGVQLAHQQVQEIEQVFLHGDVLDQRPILGPHGVPIDAVVLGVVEVIREVTPTLVEHLGELFLGAEVHLHLETDLDNVAVVGLCVNAEPQHLQRAVAVAIEENVEVVVRADLALRPGDLLWPLVVGRHAHQMAAVRVGYPEIVHALRGGTEGDALAVG